MSNCPFCNTPAPNTVQTCPSCFSVIPSDKSNGVALLLCSFFGVLGVHRFYVGKTGSGILMLFTFGLAGLWTTIDWFVILFGKFKDSNGRTLGWGKPQQKFAPQQQQQFQQPYSVAQPAPQAPYYPAAASASAYQAAPATAAPIAQTGQFLERFINNLAANRQFVSGKMENFIHFEPVSPEVVEAHRKYYANSLGLTPSERIIFALGKPGLTAKLQKWTGFIITDQAFYACMREHTKLLAANMGKTKKVRIPIQSISNIAIGEKETNLQSEYLGHSLLLNGEDIGNMQLAFFITVMAAQDSKVPDQIQGFLNKVWS